MGKLHFIQWVKSRCRLLMGKNEDNSMRETSHLLSSPRNADRLFKAMKADKAGEGIVRNVIG